MKISDVFKILKGPIQIERVRCLSSGFAVEGAFTTPILFQIDSDHLRLVELLVLHGGNLKKVAEELDISYPTLKNRLDEIAQIIREAEEKRKKQRVQILDELDRGQMSASEAASRIEDLRR